MASADSEFKLHFERGRYDVEYFARELFGVDFNPAQHRWSELVNPIDGYRWPFKHVVHVAANQIGKTLGLAIIILHAANYKLGLPFTDWDFILSSEWKWYHLGPKQGTADLTRQDMIALINGSHPAQFDMETGKRRPGYRWVPQLADTDIKFDKYYPGIELWNGSQIHFRTSEDKAVAIQGIRANGISVDEAAYEPHLLHILNGTLKMRVIAKRGPIYLVSTPDGINDYFEVVTEIQQTGRNDDHPRVWKARRKALVWSHVSDNVGYGLDAEEVAEAEAEDDPMKGQTLRGEFLQSQDAFFVPVESILKAWVAGIPSQDRPRNGHRYVIFWDPSVSSDPTVVTILDVTREPWRGVYFQRWEKPLGIRKLLPEMHRLHREWNTAQGGVGGWGPRAITAYDATSMGGAIIRQELTRLTPQRPLNFAGKNVKLNALTNMRAVLAKRRVIVPESWLRLQREVLNYRLDDTKIVQDAVMSFAGAAYIAGQGFSGAQRRKFDPGVRTAVAAGGIR